MWKNLKCYLFHHVVCNPYFRDWVNDEMMYICHCKKCKYSFVATSRWSWFRVKSTLTKEEEENGTEDSL